ncbi:MAG: tRNA adenosine(34) deaminase TadA [Mariprofundaceae bacterium]
MTEKEDIRHMRKALQQAEISAENGEVPVGAILILSDGREFAAHNAPISQHDASAHAEIRVIRMACEAADNYRLSGSKLYVTLEPCLMCAGAIIHARISRLIYGARDPKTGVVESLYQTLSDNRLNHQPEITAGVLAEDCGGLLKLFFRLRR